MKAAVPTPSPGWRPSAAQGTEPGAQRNHRFMCCIHPWMRALIKVKPRVEDDD
jgi:hypothetical protein